MESDKYHHVQCLSECKTKKTSQKRLYTTISTLLRAHMLIKLSICRWMVTEEGRDRCLFLRLPMYSFF